MLATRAFDAVRHALEPGDFYDQGNAGLWSVLCQIRDTGRDVTDVIAVADEAKRSASSMTGPALLKLTADAPGTTGLAQWVNILTRWRTHRDILRVAADLRVKAWEQTMEAGELVDMAHALLGEVGRPTGAGDVSGLSTFDEFLDRESVDEPWVVPGLLRRSWRAMFVAPEGAGKSMVARTIVLGAAQGIAPFGGPRFEPVRCLLVDCENPEDAVRTTCRPIRAKAKMNAEDYAPWRAWLWHRPDGMNLRTRADRADLERVIAATKPDVVCAGPMYKLYRPGKDGDEQAALDVMHLLDGLRMRYGFSLVLEHHAPKGQAGARELVPYGTSLWLRWPELGIKLAPSTDIRGSLDLGRFRPDRMPCDWPDRLDRGRPGEWPWVGYWKRGQQRRGAA